MELLTDTGGVTGYHIIFDSWPSVSSLPDMISSLSERSINQIVLVEACEINLLHVSHVEDILQEGKMTEHVLVWHLYRERSLSSNALH